MIKKIADKITNLKIVNSNITLYVFSAYLLVMNFLRCLNAGFWLDEAFSILMAKRSTPEMINAALGSEHPPLYYFLLHIVYKIFGDNGTAYRALSLVPFLILIIFAVTVIRKEFGKTAAYLLIGFFGCLTNSMLYIIQVRMYSFGMLYVTLAFYFVYKIIKDGSFRYWVGFTIFSSLCTYTQYYAIVAAGLMYVFLFIYFLRNEKKSALHVIYSGLVVFVIYIPWFTVMIKAMQRSAVSKWIQSVPSLMECFLFLFQDRLAIIYFLMFVGLIIYYFVRKQYRKDSIAGLIICGLTCILGTIAFGEAYSAIKSPIFVARYLIFVATLAWFIFAVIVSEIRKVNRSVGIIITICICGLLFLEGSARACIDVHASALTKQSTDSIIEAVESRRNENDLVASDHSSMSDTVLDYYFDISAFYSENITDEYLRTLSTQYPDSEALWFFAENDMNAVFSDNLEHTWEYVTQGNFAMSDGYYIYVYRIELK